MENNQPTQHERLDSSKPQERSYSRPELKKHGKLKSTASQNIVVYTYTYIT